MNQIGHTKNILGRLIESITSYVMKDEVVANEMRRGERYDKDLAGTVVNISRTVEPADLPYIRILPPVSGSIETDLIDSCSIGAREVFQIIVHVGTHHVPKGLKIVSRICELIGRLSVDKGLLYCHGMDCSDFFNVDYGGYSSQAALNDGGGSFNQFVYTISFSVTHLIGEYNGTNT